jgi:hypothetical protein
MFFSNQNRFEFGGRAHNARPKSCPTQWKVSDAPDRALSPCLQPKPLKTATSF